MELDMKIQPMFLDDECAIVFSFYFKKAAQKIGEAIIYTCTCNYTPLEKQHFDLVHNEFQNGEKVAFVESFTVVEEFRSATYEKIREFLSVIGIQNFYSNVDKRMLSAL